MVRFLTIAVCSLALLIGLLQVATRYTITISVKPSGEAERITAPAEVPQAEAASKPRPKVTDSHHTKGA